MLRACTSGPRSGTHSQGSCRDPKGPSLLPALSLACVNPSKELQKQDFLGLCSLCSFNCPLDQGCSRKGQPLPSTQVQSPDPRPPRKRPGPALPEGPKTGDEGPRVPGRAKKRAF